MKPTQYARIRIGAALAGMGALVCLAPAFSQDVDHGKPDPVSQQDVKLVTKYRSWKKVNLQPVKMEPAPAEQCAPAFPSQKSSPHLQKFINVFVNSVGKEAMTQQKAPRYPVGTVIVKEKLPKPDSRAPELLTVMVRREKGYNPENGDWEYLVFNGAGTQITAQGKLENCQSCHNQRPAADYVFRDVYFPPKLRAVLK